MDTTPLLLTALIIAIGILYLAIQRLANKLDFIIRFAAGPSFAPEVDQALKKGMLNEAIKLHRQINDLSLFQAEFEVRRHQAEMQR